MKEKAHTVIEALDKGLVELPSISENVINLIKRAFEASTRKPCEVYDWYDSRDNHTYLLVVLAGMTERLIDVADYILSEENIRVDLRPTRWVCALLPLDAHLHHFNPWGRETITRTSRAERLRIMEERWKYRD